MGSKSGIILNEAKYQRVHKDRRKDYVVFRKRIKANAGNRVQQDADLVLKNLKFEIVGQPHDDV